MKNDNKYQKPYKKQYYKTSKSRRNQKPIHGELLHYLINSFIQFLKNTCACVRVRVCVWVTVYLCLFWAADQIWDDVLKSTEGEILSYYICPSVSHLVGQPAYMRLQRDGQADGEMDRSNFHLVFYWSLSPISSTALLTFCLLHCTILTGQGYRWPCDASRWHVALAHQRNCSTVFLFVPRFCVCVWKGTIF